MNFINAIAPSKVKIVSGKKKYDTGDKCHTGKY